MYENSKNLVSGGESIADLGDSFEGNKNPIDLSNLKETD